MNKHRIGALVAAVALTLTFAGTALAGSLDWNGKNGWPVPAGCDKQDTPAGFMLWIYTGDSDTAVKLTVDGVEYTGEQQGAGNGSWHIVTPFTASKPVASIAFTGNFSAGVLTISHGCPGTTTTTTSSESTETSDTTTSTETSDTTTSDETTDTTTTTTTSSVSINTLCENCTETTTSDTTSQETTPGGDVEELTPPSTDTIGAPTSPSSVSTSLLLVLAGALATALVVIPAAARKRR